MGEVQARTFYGGEPITGAAGGEISAGKYDGPEAHELAPWKCPACGVQNEGLIHLGCVHCRSGKPGRHIGQPTISLPQFNSGEPLTLPQFDATVVVETVDFIQGAFTRWLASQPTPSLHATENGEMLAVAFHAGFLAGAQNQAARTMTAPPVTADVETLAPEGKARRTIIAALEIFKDQILSQDPEEISTGEWCSALEVDTLIIQLKGGDDEPA